MNKQIKKIYDDAHRAALLISLMDIHSQYKDKSKCAPNRKSMPSIGIGSFHIWTDGKVLYTTPHPIPFIDSIVPSAVKSSNDDIDDLINEFIKIDYFTENTRKQLVGITYFFKD